MASKLPLLLSVPHGGTAVPAEVSDNVAASEIDILADGDAHTAELYDLREDVAHVVVATVARAFVDLNRAPDDLPPVNPDGVVKTETVHEVRLYREPLSNGVIAELLAAHHAPYHAKLEALARDPGVCAGIDCHSMLSEPPTGFRNRAPRPAFCVSNADGRTAPTEQLNALCVALQDAFALPPDEVRRNDPFRGGYIVRHHAKGRLPWIQLEINRSIYLEPTTLRPLATFADTRGRLLSALRQFALSIS